jgi:hypothetical protein
MVSKTHREPERVRLSKEGIFECVAIPLITYPR